MKYLKRFNENINSSEIDAICEKYNIKNYKINDDGTVDVIGDVILTSARIYKLPFNFGKVSGDFDCSYNKLTTLEGSPRYVGGYFNCVSNRLTSLIGAPIKIDGSFNCYSNQLTSLQYCPKYIGRHIIIWENKLKNIDYVPQTYKSLKINNNPIFAILKLFVECENDESISDKTENKDLILDFIDREIIQEDILIMDRLVEFLEDVGKPQTKEYLYDLLKNIYEIL